MHRRELLRASLALAAGPLAARVPRGPRRGRDELEADLVVVGGGLGGCAAALAACRRGLRVVVTEPTPWVGGQLTAQGVPPDEHRWIEERGASRSYRALREALRAAYRGSGALTPAAAADPRVNPGGGWVSRLCVEPVVAHRVLRGLLEPHLVAGRLVLLTGAEPVSAQVEGDRLLAVRVRTPEQEVVLQAPWFVEATEEGDLYPLAGVEHVLGAESRERTGEPSALDRDEPDTIQAVTWCCALRHDAGADHRTDPPPGYARWRDFVPDLTPPWPGRLLSLTGSHPITLEPRLYGFVPTGGGAAPEEPNLWTYRQIVDPARFRGERAPVTVINWAQNDYLGGNLVGVSAEERARHLRGARELTLALVHWLRTEVPRPDGGSGWPGLALDGAAMGTADGLAHSHYVREGRRLLARTTVLEQHVSPTLRMAETGASREEVRALAYRDSVGVGHYRIDLHPTPSGRNYLDVDCLPFQVPLGALLPRRVENLVAGGKGIGTTHITNGAYRLHPVEWGVGEAAGELVAHCHAGGSRPHAVHEDADRLRAFQELLVEAGLELEWA